MMHLSDSVRYRVDVAARTLAAIAGGYFLTAVTTALLAASLPMSRVDATIISTMLSFAIYTCVVLWVFSTRSAMRLWAGMIAAASMLCMLLWLFWKAQ